MANIRTCTLLGVRRVCNRRHCKHTCGTAGTIISKCCSSRASGRIHCTAVTMFQKGCVAPQLPSPQGPILNLRVITCQEADQPRNQMTRQLGIDSRGVTNTLDSKSYSSGRGIKGGCKVNDLRRLTTRCDRGRRNLLLCFTAVFGCLPRFFYQGLEPNAFACTCRLRTKHNFLKGLGP